MRSFIILLCIANAFACYSSFANEDSGSQKGDFSYWPSETRVVSANTGSYTAAMHNRFSSIKSHYEEHGKHYYSDVTNSFGFQEVFNAEQELLPCPTGAEQSFSDAIAVAAATRSEANWAAVPAGDNGRDWDRNSTSSLRHIRGKFAHVDADSTTTSFSPAAMDQAIEAALVANDATKGRFCYDENDRSDRVDYLRDDAASAVYCPAGTEMTYSDSVSGFSCGLRLDIPLKLGETRFLRQLQGSRVTVAQGFMGCYANPSTGAPQLSLIDNPSSCSPSNRGSCIRTCDWANDVVCDPRDMPRWGGGQCGAYGTVLFKDDVVEMTSSDQISYNDASGVLFRGTAVMACASVGESVQWVVTSSNCDAVTE